MSGVHNFTAMASSRNVPYREFRTTDAESAGVGTRAGMKLDEANAATENVMPASGGAAQMTTRAAPFLERGAGLPLRERPYDSIAKHRPVEAPQIRAAGPQIEPSRCMLPRYQMTFPRLFLENLRQQVERECGIGHL